MTAPLVIWRLSDGKRGHDNQSLGLMEALARIVPTRCHELPLTDKRFSITCKALVGQLPNALPLPKLLIAAGHATHLPLIALSRASRARSVVLMKPSLPVAFFSYCLIPEHDMAVGADNVLTTKGALNRIRPGLIRNPRLGVILIGGPSKHHRWDPESLLSQVCDLVAARPDLHWHLGSSRRTPQDTLRRLRHVKALEIHEVDDTTSEWLPTMLATCSQAWVSADSVSMAYEAVSAGAATGILEVPINSPGNRVVRAQRQLLESQLAISMQDWRKGIPMTAPPAPLQESDRCARWILGRLQPPIKATSDG